MEGIALSDKTDVWMPIYIGDYLADTIGLSYSAHGLYIMLIFSYWRKGRALDKGEVEDVMRHASETDAARIKTYFKIRGEKWFHDRIERELAKALDNRNKRKTSATIASNKRWEKERASKAALYVAHPSRIRHASPSPSPSPLARERVQRTVNTYTRRSFGSGGNHRSCGLEGDGLVSRNGRLWLERFPKSGREKLAFNYDSRKNEVGSGRQASWPSRLKARNRRKCIHP